MEHIESTPEERIEAILRRIAIILGGKRCQGCGGNGYQRTMRLNNVKVQNYGCPDCDGSGIEQPALSPAEESDQLREQVRRARLEVERLRGEKEGGEG